MAQNGFLGRFRAEIRLFQVGILRVGDLKPENRGRFRSDLRTICKLCVCFVSVEKVYSGWVGTDTLDTPC